MSGLHMFASLLLVTGGTGLALARILPASLRWRSLAAPTLGTALLAVVVNAGYRYGVSVSSTHTVATVAAIAVIVATLFVQVRVSRHPRRRKTAWRRDLIVLGWWLICSVLVLAPEWIGGSQFAVFQGNHWDAFGYLDSAVVYAREPYAVVAASSNEDFLRNPLLTHARNNLEVRPGVHLLYAAFSSIDPGEAYRLSYPFLAFFLSQFMLVALFVLANLFPDGRLPWLLVAASVFPLGFWGQYVFDINAWSQLASAPVLFLLFGLLARSAAFPDERPADQGRMAACVAIVVAGGLYLYPEGLVYLLAALVPVTVAAIALRARGPGQPWALAYIPLLGIAGLASGILYHRGTLGHAFQQAQLGKVPWWGYFQAFFFGRDGGNDGPLAWSADFAAGFFGMYFVTPPLSTGLALATAMRISILVLIGLLLASLAFALPRPSVPRFTRGQDSSNVASVVIWVGVVLVSLLPAAWLAYREYYWQAGKAVSYVAPLYVTLLAVPTLLRLPSRRLGIARAAIGTFAAIQFATAVGRLDGARNPSGVHFDPPYPAIQDATLKTDLFWDMKQIAGHLPPGSRVVISEMNPWSASYLQAFLYSRGIPFFQQGPIHMYFDTGEVLGTGSMPWKPNVRLDIGRGRKVEIYFADGRAPVVVAPRRSVR